MNQQLYRIVFNPARGCLMAVAETATAQGKTGERRTGRTGRAGRTLAAAALLGGAWLAQAQIVADPSAPGHQRPTVLTTGNSSSTHTIPLVNLQTPSAAGVSRNTYSQFDVTGAGVVLNNSRTNVQTQLGGWVQGNPWLATGSARVILNEVNSGNPSQLRGAIEVAGSRAEVIIANPAGIQIDGASFINVSNATLTTGTPIWTGANGGNLDGYRVERGTVSILGAGLEARSTDSTAILARAIEINAGIWANQLIVTAGANQIPASTGAATASTTIPVTGTTPAFALDVAAIGGMYAGKITLLGIEAGLGVRNAGIVQANAGSLVLNANGWLTNTGSLTASQNLAIQTSGAISNSGALYASGNTVVTSVGNVGNASNISNTGLIAAQGDTSVASGGAITSSSGSVLAAGLASNHTVGSGGNLTVNASTNASLNGQSIAGADILIAGSVVNVANGQLSGHNLSLLATAGDVNATAATVVASQTLTASSQHTLRTDGAVLSANQLAITAHDLSNVGGQILQTGTGDLALNLPGRLDNAAGTLGTNGQLLVSTSALNNRQGRITANTSLSLNATAGVDNTDGAISATQDLHLTGGDLSNTRGTVQARSGNATLVVADLDNNAGNVRAGGNLSIQAVNTRNSGTLYAAGSQTLAATGVVSNSGTIAALGNTTITAQSIASTSTSLLAAGLKADGTWANAGDLRITTAQDLGAHGQNIAAGTAQLYGATLDLSGSQTSAGNLLLRASAGDINANHATLSATQSLVASSTQTLHTDAAVVSAQQFHVAAQALSNVGGQVLQSGTGDLALQFARTLDNTQGVIASNSQNLTLSAQTFGNTDGQILHGGTGILDITASTLNGTRGLIQTNHQLHLSAAQARLDAASTVAGQVTITSDSLSNHAGQILQTGSGATQITATTLLDNRSGLIASMSVSDSGPNGRGNTTLNLGMLDNRGGSIQTTGASSLALTATGAIDNSMGGNTQGNISAGGAATLQAASLNNQQGQISAGSSLDLCTTQGTDNRLGLIAAIGNVKLNAASLDNRQGHVAAVQGSLTVTTSHAAIDSSSTGNINNSQGRLQAAQDVHLTSSGLVNTAGLVAGAAVAIDTRTRALDNAGGTLSASGSLDVQSGALNNDTGLVQAVGALNLNTHGQTLTNTNAGTRGNTTGGISGKNSVTLTTGALDNSAGFIGATGPITATATGASITNTHGAIGSQSSIALSAGDIQNSSGQIQAIGDVQLNATTAAAGIANSAGLVRSGGHLTLTAANIANDNTQSGTQTTGYGLEGQFVTLMADNINNSQGSIRADQSLNITGTGLFNNRSGWVSSSGSLTVSDSNSSNAPAKRQSIRNTEGTLIAALALGIDSASLSGDGKVLSQGDLRIKLLGDYTQGSSAQFQATGHATLDINGNLTNQGQLLAGHSLTLKAANIANAANAEINSGATLLQATGDVTNRGLIDGNTTTIEAATLNNLGTGRIYGDHVAVAATSLRNDSETTHGVRTDAVIAARQRLDIGAQTVTNREHALIFSAGTGPDALRIGGRLDGNNQATGQAGAVYNASATIESLGDVYIAAAQLSNTNEHFSTRTVPLGTPMTALYIQPQGSTNKLLVENFVWQNWSRAGQYHFRNAPAPNASVVLGQTPIPRVGEQNCTGDEANEVCTRLPGTDYLRTHPAWAYLGVTPPTAPPIQPTLANPVAPDPSGAASCQAGSSYNANACTVYTTDMAQFNTAKAQWSAAWTGYNTAQSAWQTDTDARYTALDSRIQTYNNSFTTAEIRTWTQYAVTHSETRSEIATSDPARILSGTAIHLQGADLVNDKSQIIAGTSLTGDLASLHNVEAEGLHTVHEEGTSQYTYAQWRGGFKRYHQRNWDGLAPYAPADVVTTFVLPVTEQYQNTSPASSGDTSNTQLATYSAHILAMQPSSVTGVQPSAVGTQGTASITQANAGLLRSSQPNIAAVQTTTPLPVPGVTAVGSTASNPTVHSVTPNTRIPIASLFHTVPGSTAHYLVETDPRFANYRDWLSSDALLSALSYDPATVQKRLGDGFYEQKLIREQVAELTGRRFLSNYSSDEAQYQALIASGVTYAKAWQLRPGVALTAAQMAQLTTDMVWLVEKNVTLADGSTQKVLVPQLYAMVRDGDLSHTGALLSGGSVNVNLSGDLTNSGTIAGRSVVSLTADNVHNLGGRITGSDVAVLARTDLDNIGGQISASNSLIATAGRDITVETTTRSASNIAEANAFSRTHIDRVASLVVAQPGGILIASAGRDMHLVAANIANTGVNGQTQLSAERNLTLATVTTAEASRITWDAKNRISQASSTEVGTTVQGSGAVRLAAGNDLNIRAASVQADGALVATAANNITLEAGTASQSLDEAHQHSSKGFLSGKTTTSRDTQASSTALGSSLGGSTVALVANNDLGVTGSRIQSRTATVLAAGRNLSITAAQSTGSTSTDKQEQKSGLMVSAARIDFKASKGHSLQTETTTQVQSSITSQGDTTLLAGNQLGVQASTLGAGMQTDGRVATAGTLTLQGADVTLIAGLDSRSASQQDSEKHTGVGTFWHDPGKGLNAKEKDGLDQQNTTLVATRLSGQSITVKAIGDAGNNGTITLAGVQAKASDTLGLDAGANGTLNLNLATNTQNTSHTHKTGDVVYEKTSDKGSSAETAHYNQLELGTGGSLSLSVNAGTLNVQIAKTTAEVKAEKAAVDNAAADEALPGTHPLTLQERAQALSTQPGMSYLNQLINDSQTKGKPINWTAVELAQKDWDYKHQGLTQAGAIIVAIVVTVVTAGAASGAGASIATSAGMTTTTTVAATTTAAATTTVTLTTAGSVVAAGVAAGMTTLATQASVSLINNGGDIGKTLHDLGSSENVKSLLTSMVTAGALQGLGQALDANGLTFTGSNGQSVSWSSINATSPFAQQLTKNLVNNLAAAGINSAIEGGSLEKGLQASIASAFIQTGMAQGANLIGDSTQVNSFSNYAAHAIAGCVAGAATSASNGGNSGSAANACGSGALGASLGEAAAVVYGRNENTAQIASLVSALGAAVVGGDAQQINIAAMAGWNAAANNYLNHDQAAAMKKEMAACKTTSCTDTDERAIRDKYIALSNKNIDNVKAMIVAGDVAGIKAAEGQAASTAEVSGIYSTRWDEEIFTNRQTNVTVYGSVKGKDSLFGSDLQQTQEVASFRKDNCAGISSGSCNALVTQALDDRMKRLGVLMLAGALTPAAVNGIRGLRIQGTSTALENPTNVPPTSQAGSRGKPDAMLPDASLTNVYANQIGGKPLGTQLGSYDMVAGGGPLPSNLAGTFSGGRYTEVITTEPVILYRAGTKDAPLGQFFSTEQPVGVIQTRVDQAVLPVWPGGGTSPLDSVFKITIPTGTKMYYGEIGAQNGFYVGGTQQIVVQSPWKIPGVKSELIGPLK